MSQVKRIDSADTTPASQVTPSSTSSSVIFLGPRPTLPKQRLTARPIPRDLWDGNHADRAFGYDPVGAA